jgi:hypothetical protein
LGGAAAARFGTLRRMVELLTLVENNEVSVFIREFPSVFGFPTILFLHTLGLAMVAGVSIAMDLWILRGAASAAPLRLLGLTRTMWLGFGINLVSGLALLVAYPAKALTNGVFYLKMALVLSAVYIAVRINRELAARGGGAVLTMASDARRWAVVSLAIWAAATITGRLLAYTHSVLFAYELQ